jgi:TPR repeat protein
MYKEGQGVPQDYDQAVKWFDLAAKQGYAPAQFALGIMYNKGLGVPQDYAEAGRLYRLAAAQGHADAQYNLGRLYHGHGLPQDYSEAAKWYALSAQQGTAAAQVGLATLYLEGKGVAKDAQEAIRLLRLAAAQGDAYALGNLGFLYQSGEGVVQSNVIAYVLFDLAANADSSDSNFAVDSRRNLAELLSAQDIEAARNLAQEMQKPGQFASALDSYSNRPEVRASAALAGQNRRDYVKGHANACLRANREDKSSGKLSQSELEWYCNCKANYVAERVGEKKISEAAELTARGAMPAWLRDLGSQAEDFCTGQLFQRGSKDECEERAQRVFRHFFPYRQPVVVSFSKGQPIFFMASNEKAVDGSRAQFVPCGQTLDNFKDYFSLTVFNDEANSERLAPEDVIVGASKGIERRCARENIVNKPLGVLKVDSYDARAGIVGCANFPGGDQAHPEPDHGHIVYYLAIRGEHGLVLLWRSKNVPPFDPSYPPLSKTNLPEMPQVKLCEKRASAQETMDECLKRRVR